MRNAILLHGKPGEKEYYDPAFPSPSNYHWFPWLQKQLLVKDIKADTPEVPLAFDPQYELWVTEVERFDITKETLLVGHSCGGGFWVRYLSEHPDLHVGKVILVAPSLGKNWDKRNFFDFTIDPQLVSRCKELIILYSDNDSPFILDAVKILENTLKGAVLKEFHGLGHFTHSDMKKAEFPELLTECLR